MTLHQQHPTSHKFLRGITRCPNKEGQYYEFFCNGRRYNVGHYQLLVLDADLGMHEQGHAFSSWMRDAAVEPTS